MPKPAFTAPPPLTGRTSTSCSGRTASSRRSRSATSRSKRSDPRWYELTLANTIYGGAFNSRIVRNIREEKGYTYSPGSALTGFADAGFYRFAADVRNEVTGATLTEVFKEIDKLRAEGSNGTELQGAKAYLRGLFPIQTATQAGLADDAEHVYVFGLPKDYPETFRAKIAAVTPSRSRAGAAHAARLENSVIAIVGDYAKVKDQLTGYKDITFLDTDGKKIRAALPSTNHRLTVTANDYHFVSRWRVEGTCGEVADVLGDPLALPRWWPSVYLRRRRSAAARCARRRTARPAAHQGLAAVHAAMGSRRHRLAVSRTASRSPRAATSKAAASGRSSRTAPSVDITYDWRIAAEKPLLRQLSFLLKPLFEANHRWAMAQGEESLALELARRRAPSDAARAPIPPPPGPMTLAGVALARRGAVGAVGVAAGDLMLSIAATRSQVRVAVSDLRTDGSERGVILLQQHLQRLQRALPADADDLVVAPPPRALFEAGSA